MFVSDGTVIHEGTPLIFVNGAWRYPISVSVFDGTEWRKTKYAVVHTMRVGYDSGDGGWTGYSEASPDIGSLSPNNIDGLGNKFWRINWHKGECRTDLHSSLNATIVVMSIEDPTMLAVLKYNGTNARDYDNQDFQDFMYARRGTDVPLIIMELE